MEFGESDLQKLLRTKLEADNARLDLSFTRYYWQEMLECVGAIQQDPYNIVHSDLKPANFVLVGGRLKLIDFGIANAIDIDETMNVHRDSHVGTPNFMSPESLEDTNAGVRDAEGGRLKKDMRIGKPSDVWSLGCILYQMTYGRPPFAHISNQIHRVMAIINPNVVIEYPATGVGGMRVPSGLRTTLRRCLQRDPTRRPTIDQLLDERDPFLYPDNSDDLRIPQDLLAQIIQRVADRFRDPHKAPPTDEEIRQYPASFYAKIRELLEEG
jgi:serine/threonine-protein kinase TTK/MPS1